MHADQMQNVYATCVIRRKISGAKHASQKDAESKTDRSKTDREGGGRHNDF